MEMDLNKFVGSIHKIPGRRANLASLVKLDLRTFDVTMYLE